MSYIAVYPIADAFPTPLFHDTLHLQKGAWVGHHDLNNAPLLSENSDCLIYNAVQ